MALALLGGAAKAIGGGIVKNVAKDKAKNFITGKKKKVKPEAIKKSDDSYTPGKGGSALAVRPQTSLVPQITPVSASEVSSESKSSGDTLTLIKTKVFEINKFLKGSLAQEKASSKKDKKSDEKQKRKKQESTLEKIAPKPKGILKKITAPAKGLFDGIFNFISNILLGRLLVVLLESKKDLPGGSILMFLANMAEKVIDTIIGTLDAFGSFLLFGQQKLDGAKSWLKENRGDEAGERFDELLGSLTNLFNAAVIVGSVFAALGIAKPPKGPKKPKGPKGQKPGVKPTKPLIKKPGMKPTGPSNAAKLVQKKHGHAARGIYQNSYDNAISKGRTPKQAAETANAAVKRAIDKGKIISKPQTGSLGGTDKGSKITKGGVKKIPKRLATKALGKAGVKTLKGIAKGFGKVPIMGPLIVGVASLLAGEPLGQAVFKGLGAALGGFLGTFIPIPVIGTILGEMIGTLVGDMLYSLTMGGGIEEAGQKFMTAVKSALDVGGLIVNFFKEGFGRFFNDFPTVDVPNFLPFDAIQKAIATVFPFFDKDGDGKVGKIPNLSILFNPVAMITELIPHAAASFLPDIFGSGGTAFKNYDSSGSKEPDKSTSGGNSGGTEPHVGEAQSVPQTGNASGETGKSGNAIYLHWTAGNYTSTAGPYHTVFTGDGTMHRKTEYTKRSGHTEGRNTNSVGLSLASNPDIGQWPTEEQRVAMAKEAARIAKNWGWSASDINLNKVLTHGEAGSNLDGVNATTNYGLFGRGDSRVQPEKEKLAKGSIASFERWDLDIMKKGDKYGSGGDEMRNRIKGFMKLGGPTRGRGLYVMGEEGPEFTFDTDSYMAIESALPGALSIVNKAKGKDAVEALMAYTDYERPPEPEMAMVGGSSSGGSGSYGDSGGESMVSPSVPEGSSGTDSSWKDIRYKFG